MIDLTCLSFHLSGIERYALCISKELIINDLQNNYILVFRNEVYADFIKYIDGFRIKSVILKGKNKKLFLLFGLPNALNKIKADCYLFLATKSPILFRKKKIYNTIHDLVAWDCPQTMRILQNIYSRIMNKNAAVVSERIITVSEFSKERINSILNYPKEKIIVAYSAVSSTLCKSEGTNVDEVLKKYGITGKYIMNLSTLEPRKNLELLLKCFDKIADSVNFDIVLIGRRGWKINKLMKQIEFNDRIHITGFVDDMEIVPIYQNAMCFVFPSIYEGFGLPPVEALSLGTPVLSSNAASLPEILRKQALYFENNNKYDLCQKLLNIEEMISTMPCHLDDFQKENFSFSKSASIILNTMTSDN